MRILVTGGAGFLGWHFRCRALSLGIETVSAGRRDFSDVARLAGLMAGVEGVVHLAGVNRGTDAEVAEGNPSLARRLVEAMETAHVTPEVVYAGSIQSKNASAYGLAKQQAADILQRWAGRSGATFSHVMLPNLFGEHGRPHYNSFVATFSHEIAAGRQPVVSNDRDIPLMHAQDATRILLRTLESSEGGEVHVDGLPVPISTVRSLLLSFRSTYSTGEIPDLCTPFLTQLFNTLRSHLFPSGYPMSLERQVDARGVLVECVRARAPQGQTFISSTVPGATRGDHFHLRKFERFVVVDGSAEIALRRLFTREVLRFPVSGDAPSIIDMPTMWVHNIRNTGSQPLTTLFWTNELYDPSDPDTFPRQTAGSEEAA